MAVAPAQSETRLTVVKVRTCLAFEARTFDGLHVAAITPVKKSFFNNLSNAFQVMLDLYSIKVLLHGRNNENVLHKKEIFFPLEKITYCACHAIWLPRKTSTQKLGDVERKKRARDFLATYVGLRRKTSINCVSTTPF